VGRQSGSNLFHKIGSLIQDPELQGLISARIADQLSLRLPQFRYLLSHTARCRLSKGKRTMLFVLAGSLLSFTMFQEVAEVEPHPRGNFIYEQHYNESPDSLLHRYTVEPLRAQQFRNVVRQQFDYSCGAASLTTILQHYLGQNLGEKEVMEGLLQFGESERIVERRAFSMLDMKRLVSELGFPSGGFRAEMSDLAELDHPALVPIQHAGFEHFVVVRDIREGRVFVADPSAGNLSFTLHDFKQKWSDNVLFIVFPGEEAPLNNLALKEEDMRFIEDQTLTLQARQEFPAFHESLERDIQNELERLKNNPDGSVENTRKRLYFRSR